MDIINIERLKIMKKIFIVILLVCVLCLTGCEWWDARKQANQYVKQYSKTFKEQIKDTYGKDAKLKNIKCGVYTSGTSPVPSISFHACGALTADLIINKNSYYAEYQFSTNTLSTDVHLKDIVDEFISYMPVDSEKIFYWDAVSSSRFKLTFEPSVKSLSDLSEIDMGIYIITTEDLSNVQEDDFKNLDIFDTFDNINYSFHIFSVKDVNKIDGLKERIYYIEVLNDQLFDANSSDNYVPNSDNVLTYIFFGKTILSRDENAYYKGSEYYDEYRAN